MEKPKVSSDSRVFRVQPQNSVKGKRSKAQDVEQLKLTEVLKLPFDAFYEACGVNQSVNVDYASPIRFCGACWKANVRNGAILAREAGMKNGENVVIFNLLPKAGGALANGLDPVQTVKQGPSDAFYEPEFKVVVKEFQQISHNPDADVLKTFIAERKALTMHRLNFHAEVVKWEIEVRTRKNQEEQEQLQHRRRAIEDKLRELGYDPSEYPSNNSDFTGMLLQYRPLTPKIWNTILPKLTRILDEERKRRAEIEFKNKWRERREQLEKHYTQFLQEDRDGSAQKRTFPGFEDAIAQARHVLTGNEPKHDVTEAEFAAFEAAVLGYVDKYRAKARTELVKKLQEATAALSGQPAKKAKKGKGTGLDRDAEMALLDEQSSLFLCQWHYGPYNPECVGDKPYAVLLEHWQQCHSSTPWHADVIIYPGVHDANHIPRLARALGLPEDAKLSAILDVIYQGRPECACGSDPYPAFAQEPQYQTFTRLFMHVNDRQYG
ncbi:hypothetical protein GY45DRAFT_1337188 [Cubamyces sp. BRFM 1775]|nr:hypothetical protein GY45DRAFT_1337188 [Cubamyces sp. BRFM 1775]